jgi:hypothetical protein
MSISLINNYKKTNNYGKFKRRMGLVGMVHHSHVEKLNSKTLRCVGEPFF